MVLEKEIERYLSEQAKAQGGLSLKWVCPSWNGVPDRIVLLPSGRICFIETKAPGKRLRPQQKRWQERLVSLGFKAYSADSKADIDEILRKMQGENKP
ncbi:MAG: VRR-NUC domain-containing protein [Ruminococcus sp.]|nr:VRR-NUC domain-containing protein [Ruminococcus sp.]